MLKPRRLRGQPAAGKAAACYRAGRKSAPGIDTRTARHLIQTDHVARVAAERSSCGEPGRNGFLAEAPMAAKTIYLGTDFSPASERAFDEALARAKLRGAELVIGHVIPPPGLLGYGVGGVALAVETRIREGMENDLEALRQKAERAGISARIEILPDRKSVV